MKPTQKQCYSGIGGQAVLEGVMMKNCEKYAVAIRKLDGTLTVERGDYPGLLHGSYLLRIPFVRGVFVFLDSLILGMRCVNLSAEYYAEEESETKADAAQEEGEKQEADKKEGSTDTWMSVLVVGLSLVLAIGLFMILPYFLAQWIGRFTQNRLLKAALEGILRLAIFLTYMVGISLMKDIRRLYQYHGAEHKCINCLESGKALTLENARESTRFHKRCGTSFILLVVLVSIVVFFFIRAEDPLTRVVLRVLLLPVISGISYELIRLAGRSSHPLVQAISLPGLWTQRITTREPDDEMLEVAMASVEAVFDWKTYLAKTFPESAA